METGTMVERKSRKRKSSNEFGQMHTASTPSYSRSIKEKLEIIDYAKISGNRAAGRMFNVAESSIREWRKNEPKFLKALYTPSLSSTQHNIKNNNNNIKFNNNDGKNCIIDINDLKKEFSFPIPINFSLPMNLSFAAATNVQGPSTSNAESGSVGTPNSLSSISSASSPPPSISPPISSQLTGSSRRKSRKPQKVIQEP